MKNIKQTICLFLALCLLLCACQSEPQEELPQELTLIEIYGGSPSTGLSGLVKEFQKAHPDVKVTIEVGIPGSKLGDGNAYHDFMQKMAVELMSGEAPDILDTLGNLTPRDCASSHLLYNLYEWMEQDEDFAMDDYYENLIKSMEYEGQLFTLPVNFQCETAYLNRNILDALGLHYDAWDTLDYQDILSISQQAQEQGLVSEDYTLEFEDLCGAYALFLDQELPDFIDLEAGTVSFDSPEFIEYLEDTKRIPTHRETEGEIRTISGGDILQHYSDSLAEENTSLLLKTTLLLDDLAKQQSMPENCVGPLVITSRKGTAAYYPFVSLSVPTSCQNPELAWEFLKFCIAPVDKPSCWGEPEGGTDIARGCLPVGKANLRAYGDLYAQRSGETLSEPFWDGFSGMISSITASREYYYGVLNVTEPVLLDYYNTSTLTAEECARLMQEKATIYFGER